MDIMANYKLDIKTNCSREEKLECLPRIQRMMELSNISRRSGLLALEAELLKENNFLLKEGVMLVVDGSDPEFVEAVLLNHINASGKTGKELLESVIITYGTLAIQEGMNPRLIRCILLSYLGDDVMDEATKYLDDCAKAKELEDKAENESTYSYFQSEDTRETVMDAGILAFLFNTPYVMEIVLAHFNDKIIADALRYSSRELQRKVFTRLSSRRVASIVKELASTRDYNEYTWKDSSYAQKIIKEKLLYLEERSEVVVF